jgi:hypothetical protein
METEEHENEKNTLIGGTKSEIDYYRIVRTTLHGLDGVRLKASVSGLSVCSVFIGLGFTALKYVDDVNIMSYDIPLPLLLAFCAYLLATLSGIQFIKKVEMFSHFITCCVEISHDFENKLVVQEAHKLTRQFEKHTYAGSRGDNLFKSSLILMVCISVVGAITCAIAFFVNLT